MILHFEGCPIHPICIGSPKWWRSVTDRDGSAAFVSSRHVVGSLRSGRMVTSVAVCQFARDLENIHGVVMEWVVNFGGSWRMVSSRVRLFFRQGLMKWSWLCYGVRWKCRRIVLIGTDGSDPSQPWRMVSIRFHLSVRERLKKHSWGVVEWGGNVGGSSRSGRIATTRHKRERWGRFVSVCLFARDLENGNGGVMEWGDNIGGSFRSGRIVTTRQIRDGWWHFVTVCQFGREPGVMECGGNFGGSSRSERITTTRHECDGWCRLVSVCLFARAFKSYLVVWWSGEQFSADRPDRDGSQRPVTSVTDGDVSWQSVSS